MATQSRKPRIDFTWREQAGEYVCDWALIGSNGEYIVGSGPQGGQGFRDRQDASRSVDTVIALLPAVRRTGPGEKPG